jgi:hypothetical protein
MNYTWNIAGTESTTPDNPYTTALTTANTDPYTAYTYTVYATNANGCTSTVSEAGTVTVYAVPVVEDVSSATVCSGLTAALSATASNVTDPATYTWYVGDYSAETTTTSTYTTPALTATATTYITYTVQITNDTGCTSARSEAGIITVNPLPEPVFLSAPTAPVCSNSEATFTVDGAEPGPGSYCFRYDCPQCLINHFLTGEDVPPAAHCRWDSTWVCGTANTYSMVMPDSGTMTVWVQAENKYGCTSTTSTVVTIYDAFDAGSIITASTTTDSGVDPSVTVASVAPATGGDGNITYQWRRSGTSSATLTGSNETYALSADASSNYGTVGTYYFNRYAKHGSCNSVYTASNGQYSLTVALANSLPPYSGTQTWTYGAQTWSGALSNPVSGCASVTSLSNTDYTAREYKDNGSTYGYYYSWSCVSYYKSALCPPPWRVPSRKDAEALDELAEHDQLISDWGLPGIAEQDIVDLLDPLGFAWTESESDDLNGYGLEWRPLQVGVFAYPKVWGLQVRCVL